jgi:hypothetical protein
MDLLSMLLANKDMPTTRTHRDSSANANASESTS